MLPSQAQAPDFTLHSLDGAEVALQELWQTGPVLLVFFKDSCPTCQLTFPFLERLHRGKVKVMAISQDDAKDTAAFHSRFGISLPTLLDPKPQYAASNAYGISSVPSLFWIDAGGSIGWSDSGFDRTRLEQLGRDAGIETFAKDEAVPALQAG